jgi:competence ComEA-like helix-hairpin-helix protein
MRRLFVLLLILLSPFARGAESKAWEIWDDCRLETDKKYFDGDSFHVRHGRESAILRLYFVDAPEIDAGYGVRVSEQAAYYRVSDANVLTAGRAAKNFTEKFLAGPFRVITRRQVAPGASRSERYYAIVESNGQRLDSALIAAGLARVSGEVADYPDSGAGQKTVQELRLGEQKAAKARQGVWAYSSGRVEQVTGQVGDAVKAGFGRVVDQAVGTVIRKVTGSKGADARINLNTATAAELEGLPGIGPKTADLIVQARPLKNLDSLAAVRGIGPKKLEALRNLVRFE